jgi:hypothetical protein
MTSLSDPRTTGAIVPRSHATAVVELPGRESRGTPRRQRAWSRAVHLLAGLVLGTYVYAPAVVAQPLHLALQVIVIPTAILSGLFLWKQAQIRRLMRRRAGIR